MDVPQWVERLGEAELEGINWFKGESAGRPNLFRPLSEVAADIKQQLSGHWSSVLGLDLHSLSRKGTPCPKCPSSDKQRDRFHAFGDSESTGAVGCRKCPNPNGKTPYFITSNGIDTYAWLKGIEWVDAVKELAEQNGIQTTLDVAAPPPKPLSIIEQVARAKRMPLESFLKYGVTAAVRNGKPVARVQFYNHLGDKYEGWFDQGLSDKGMNKFGSPAGVFLPGRKPIAGEHWCITEGVKDAAMLDSLGFLTIGLAGKSLKTEFVSMLKGVHVVCVPDLDTPSLDGFDKICRSIYRVAASIRVCRLPGAIKDSDGDGVREVVAKIGGDEAKRLVDTASEWTPPKPKSVDKLEARKRAKEENEAELRLIVADWEVHRVSGEPSVYRLFGPYFELAGPYIEIDADDWLNFRAIQNILLDRCNNPLDMNLCEAWPQVAIDLARGAKLIEGGIDRNILKTIAVKIVNLARTRAVDHVSKMLGRTDNDATFCGLSFRYLANGKREILIDSPRLCQEIAIDFKEFRPRMLTRLLEACHIKTKPLHVQAYRYVARPYFMDDDAIARMGEFAGIASFDELVEILSGDEDKRREKNGQAGSANDRATIPIFEGDRPAEVYHEPQESGEDTTFGFGIEA